MQREQASKEELGKAVSNLRGKGGSKIQWNEPCEMWLVKDQETGAVMPGSRGT
jgi:hypothetical protein